MRNHRKNIYFIFALLLVITIWTISPAFTGGDQEKAKQAWPMIQSGVLLIDVRTEKEFNAGHLEDAVNIPWEDMAALKQAIGDDKQRQVVLYCRSGNRSGKAIAMLKKDGYTNLFNGTGLGALQATKP